MKVKLRFLVPNGWIKETEKDLIGPVAPCHDASVMELYPRSNPVRVTVMTAKLED